MEATEFAQHWTRRWANWRPKNMPKGDNVIRVAKQLLAASTTGAWTRVVFNGNGIFVEQPQMVGEEESLEMLSVRFGHTLQHPFFLKSRVGPAMWNNYGSKVAELGFQIWCSHPDDVLVLRLSWFDRIASTREFKGDQFEEAVRDIFNVPWSPIPGGR